MKFYFLRVFCALLFVANANASNIAVIDTAGIQSHIDSLGSRVLNQVCFSVEDDSTIEQPNIGADPDIRHYLKYKQASGCPNKGTSDNRVGSREIIETVFHDSSTRTTTLTTNHLSNVIHIAQQHTSQNFLGVSASLWLDKNGFFVSPVSLKNSIDGEAFLDALNYVSSNANRHNIRVLNLSLSQRYHVGAGACDNNLLPSEQLIRNRIYDLINQGIVVVASAGNENPQGGTIRGTYFPGCLSAVIAVAGRQTYDGKLLYAGTLSPKAAYVEPINHIGYNGDTIFGTSFSSPYVAAVIAEMMATNPTLSSNEIVTRLFNTSDDTGRIYFPLNSNSYDTNRKKINPQRAINSVRDPFWKEIIEILKDVVSSVRIGWNYGSSQHNNGAIVVFPQISLPAAKAKNISISNSNKPVVRFSFRAYDIDTADEVEVLVNDRPYGHLSTTGSNATGGIETLCIPKADLSTSGKNEVKLRLKTSGETWGVTSLKVETGIEDAACLQATGPSPLDDNDDRIEGFSDPVGNAYGQPKESAVDIDFNFATLDSEIPTPSNYNTTDVRRDVRIKFIGKGGDSFSTNNGTIVTVLGSQVLATPNIHGDEQEYEVIVNRALLRDGNNRIRLRPRRTTTGSVWGIRNVSIEYIEPIDLTVGTQDSGEYGYNQSPTRYAGLRANFNLTETANDHEFSVKGWDIDRATETRVFINGNAIGYLGVSPNRAYNSGTSFVLPKALLKQGKNQIEIMQSDSAGVSVEQWAVKDLKVSLLKPDLVALDVDILDKILSPNDPFTVSTTISNVGAGSAGATTLHYYRSSDPLITTSDSQMTFRPIGGINSGATLTLEHQLQSSFVNKGYYIGVCVAGVTNEAIAANNCSSGVKLRSTPKTAPILMILLDDD